MKGGYIALIIIAVIAVAGIGAFFYLTGSSNTVAYLNIESGSVQVNSGNGWETATDQMNLKEDYYVKTLEDGQASIVFYESDIMELSPNTEVELATIVANQIKVNQNSGSTWNRVSKLTGTREYEVETPNSVATVRGTGFGVNVSEEGDEIIVDEGTVDCGLSGGQSIMQVSQFRKCVSKNGQVSEANLTEEQLLLMKQKVEKGITILETMQLRELNKKRFFLNMAKKKYNFTDGDVSQFIGDVNSGKKSLDEVKKKIPVKVRTFDKIERITLKIIELNKLLEEITNKLASMQ